MAAEGPSDGSRYDVVIIGGGVYGAALLWEAASRGLHALLLEQQDFAGATSANSLKIIHGGIRYLQDLDFSRIRRSIAERRALLRIAPHLVEPLSCVMPTDRSLSKGRIAVRLGFALYDFLARHCNDGVDPLRHVERSRLLSREELLQHLPWLDDPAVTGGACWQDARVWNTERLVLAFVMSAVAAGAHACNYTRVEALLREGRRVVGVTTRDVHAGTMRSIAASLVVDCRGPWQGHALVAGDAVASPRFARAYNLLVKRPLADVAFGVRMPAGGGGGGARLLFSAPWRGGSIIGTWYDRRQETPESLTIGEEEIGQALQQINQVLPGLDLRRSEVSGVHVGLLPCTGRGDKEGEPVLMRHHRILAGEAGTGLDRLIQVQGVKYTTARQVAEEVVSSYIAPALGRRLPPSRTQQQPLYGGDLAELQSWRRELMAGYGERYGQPLLDRLMRNYGSCVGAIMRYVEQDTALGEFIPGLDDTLRAELAYVVDHERVRTLADVILRRTDIGSFGRPPLETLEYCCHMLAARHGWDGQRQDAEMHAVLSGYETD